MKFLFLLLFIPFLSFSQNKPSYLIYNSQGKQVSYSKMKKACTQADITFFGEYHDNPIAHWLSYELLVDLYQVHQQKLILGFEMFEQDQQEILNRYLEGKIPANKLKDSLRLWPNYETDYKPLIDFAQKNKLACIASNVERKYASLLFKKGRAALDTLSPKIKEQMAPIDFPIDSTLSQYAALNEMAAHMGGGNMLASQAFKDATMAQFIFKALKKDSKFIHFNGAYHSDYQQGILWYLHQSAPGIKSITISTHTQLDIEKFDKENIGKADFIICVPETMTRTH